MWSGVPLLDGVEAVGAAVWAVRGWLLLAVVVVAAGGAGVRAWSLPQAVSLRAAPPPDRQGRRSPRHFTDSKPPAPPGASCLLQEFTVPTFDTLPRFTADFQHLTPAQRRRFRRVVLDAFVPDLRTGLPFRPGLRIKGVRVFRVPTSSPGPWAPDPQAAPPGSTGLRSTPTHRT